MQNNAALEIIIEGEATDASLFVNGIVCKPCGLPYQQITDIYTCPEHKANWVHRGCGNRDGSYCVVNGCDKQIVPLIPQQTGESISLNVMRRLYSTSQSGSEQRIILPNLSSSSSLPVQEPVSVVYKDLVFEQSAHRDAGVAEKKLFCFDVSLERVKNAGFARHALPCEVFSLIIDGLEGKLSAQELSLKIDMLVGFGEWLSMAFKRVGNTLHCYEHPENLVWTGSSYDASCMTSAGEKMFSLKKGFLHSALPSRKFIPLNDVASVCPDLVQYLWSREMSQLPSDIKTRAGLWLHEEGIVWPVGRRGCSFGVVGYGYGDRASRGVVAAQKLS